MGIKELKELVVFMAVLAGAVDRSTKDGLGLDDVAYFMPVFLKAPEAFEGMDKAKLEAGELSADELSELNTAVAEALDLADDRVEAIVEKSLAALINIYSIVQEVKALKA